MTLNPIGAEKARSLTSSGGLLIDIRPFEEYLQNHIRSSVSLQFEAGPGFGGRARDLLPLDARLVLIDDNSGRLSDAAAMLRGKGFTVHGYVSQVGLEDISQSTRTLDLADATGLLLINVADPGTKGYGDELFIPAESLWSRVSEIDTSADIGVLAGWGVRAAAAIGILENLGRGNPVFVRTLAAGSKPSTTASDQRIFRVGGPG